MWTLDVSDTAEICRSSPNVDSISVRSASTVDVANVSPNSQWTSALDLETRSGCPTTMAVRDVRLSLERSNEFVKAHQTGERPRDSLPHSANESGRTCPSCLSSFNSHGRLALRSHLVGGRGTSHDKELTSPASRLGAVARVPFHGAVSPVAPEALPCIRDGVRVDSRPSSTKRRRSNRPS